MKKAFSVRWPCAIPEGSEYVAKTIIDSGLRTKDVVVLNLHRGTRVISNPKDSRELESDEVLLCDGELESMRDLVPKGEQKKRRVKVKELDPTLVAGLVSV